MHSSSISMRDTCPAHPILLSLTFLITFSEEYKLISISFWNFICPPVTLPFYGKNTLLSTLISKIPSLCSSLHILENKFHAHAKLILDKLEECNLTEGCAVTPCSQFVENKMLGEIFVCM
jgi:hypothetical protein